MGDRSSTFGKPSGTTKKKSKCAKCSRLNTTGRLLLKLNHSPNDDRCYARSLRSPEKSRHHSELDPQQSKRKPQHTVILHWNIGSKRRFDFWSPTRRIRYSSHNFRTLQHQYKPTHLGIYRWIPACCLGNICCLYAMHPSPPCHLHPTTQLNLNACLLQRPDQISQSITESTIISRHEVRLTRELNRTYE